MSDLLARLAQWRANNRYTDDRSERLEREAERADLALDALALSIRLHDMRSEFDRLKQDVPDVATAVVLEAITIQYGKGMTELRTILAALRGTK